MANGPLPDQATLLKLLRYDPETGKLYWRSRQVEMFSRTSNPAARCAGFNSAYADREAFTASHKGYRIGGLLGLTSLRAHRVIWCMVHGYWPDQIDHINQDRSDNRLTNLREVGREENARNARLSARNRSGRIGVYWSPRRRQWRAKIRHDGKYVELGFFRDFDEACAARAEAERAYGYSEQHGRRKVAL